MKVSNYNYNAWLDDTDGIRQTRKTFGGFNNVVFTAEYIAARKELGTLDITDIKRAKNHLKFNDDGNGLYKPKNSHDNILSVIYISQVLKLGIDHNVGEAVRGKHPRDWILFNFFLNRKFYHWLLLPLAMLDMARAIISSGKVRPKIYEPKNFIFRVKAMLGIIKPIRESTFPGGRDEIYNYKGVERRIFYVQNDGKILNLLRLSLLRHHSILKPVVKLYRILYIWKLGKNFQSVMFENYFGESDHPVRVMYRKLDELGKTIID